MNVLIKKVEAKYSRDNIDEIKVEVGDKVKAILKVIEGQKERLQTFEGLVIAKNGKGINKSITIRKISYGIGVERIVPLNSTKLDTLKVESKGAVKRSKLYYLRGRVGKAALKVKTK
jgi:large subunit ribosomal protein L19